MPEIRTILIYQTGAVQTSIQDLRTLTETLFFSQQKQSALLWDSNSLPNLEGNNPKQTLIVIPGGSAMSMLSMSPEEKNLLTRQIGWGAHGLYSCAGAYVCTKQFHLLDCRLPETIVPSYSSTLEALDLIQEYESYGPFFPVQPRETRTKEKYLSCDFVKIKYGQQISILPYAAGPMFIPIRPRLDWKVDVVARYADRPFYTICFPDHSDPDNPLNQEVHQIPAPPAILRKKATVSTGGFFASGPHIEACVPNSRLLAAMQEGDPQHFGLDLSTENARQFNPKSELKRVEALLKETFLTP